jgi:DNA-binding MarR family transcriptional regulator
VIVPDEAQAPAVTDMPVSTDLTGLILLAGHLFEQRLDQALEPEGLTARQYRALQHIALNPEVTRVELAHVLRISRQASGGISQRLQKAGLIERNWQGPGLSVSFMITESGRRHLRRASPIVIDTERHILAGLSTSSAHSLVDVVHELIAEMT